MKTILSSVTGLRVVLASVTFRLFLKCSLHYTKYIFERSRVQGNTPLTTGFAFTKGLLALDFEVGFLEKYVYFSLIDMLSTEERIGCLARARELNSNVPLVPSSNLQMEMRC